MKNRNRKIRTDEIKEGFIRWYVGKKDIVIFAPSGQKAIISRDKFASVAPDYPTNWCDPHSGPYSVTPAKVKWWVRVFMQPKDS